MLVIRIADGDHGAFEELYARTARRLFGLALRVAQRPELAEEIVQDVYVQVWASAKAFDPARGTVLAWLFTLTHHRAVDIARHERSCLERDSRYHREKLALGGSSVEEITLRKLGDENLASAFSAVSFAQAEAISLAYFGGRTYTEVAEILQLSVPAVKSRIRDGFRALRQVLGPAGDG